MYTSEVYVRELTRDRLREADDERLAREATAGQVGSGRGPLAATRAIAARIIATPLRRTRGRVAGDAGCVTNATGA